MMSSNISIKSALLALTMVVAAPTANAQQAPKSPVSHAVTFTCNHPLAVSMFALTWGVFESRLRTRPKTDFKLEDLRQDFKDVLNSLNIFDSALYKQLLYMFDKYIIGLPIKIEETTTRTKSDDGSVVTIKGKKLVQKPFGLYGYFDAYALMHMKKFIDYVPVIVGCYLLIDNPGQFFETAATKAGK
jgi:hypothetical protein